MVAKQFVLHSSIAIPAGDGHERNQLSRDRRISLTCANLSSPNRFSQPILAIPYPPFLALHHPELVCCST